MLWIIQCNPTFNLMEYSDANKQNQDIQEYRTWMPYENVDVASEVDVNISFASLWILCV